jgi:hypothetical protein
MRGGGAGDQGDQFPAGSFEGRALKVIVFMDIPEEKIKSKKCPELYSRLRSANQPATSFGTLVCRPISSFTLDVVL